ncbi:cation diffusion facilitator family transporter [Dyella silvatica]|uniref:cation diffusion facilitator family transporter n=1 Tax=Dyella silvatica TaxID=2992128 RepID=UPI0022529323|nr:cation diffusion facilitator family transporter [Dyella silvatica]
MGTSEPHKHDHEHHHSHAVAADADKKYLIIALLLLLSFMAVEVVIGIMAKSLALLSDAGHMLTDVGAIGLALVAMRLAKRPATGSYTFGLKRVEILSAQANGVTLLLLSAWFIIEAIRRLIDPPVVEGQLVTVIAVVGIGVNLLAVWAMSKANRQSLNVEGSFQHVLTDLYAFIATAIAGGIIWWTGWNRVDSIATLVVAGLMLKAGIGLVRESGRIFLEAAPRGLDPLEIAEAIRAVPAVTRLDDLHVWEVTSGMPALSAHIYVDHDIDCHDVRRTIEAMLHDRFDITHTTLQTDHAAVGQIESANCAFESRTDEKHYPT